MRQFTKEIAHKILKNEIPTKQLLSQYPEYQQDVLKEIEDMKREKKANLIPVIIDRYKGNAKIAIAKITKSGMNEKTINSFLPQIIKARFALYLLEQLHVVASSDQDSGPVRFNFWDGTILQKLLFKRNLERKPVSLRTFRFFWKFIVRKRTLMPLVNKKGIYCFYSKDLIKEVTEIIGNSSCLEIAAGDGTLTRFLNDRGIACHATDDYSWAHYIRYATSVEKLDAKSALQKYNPEVVICSWPAPKNTFEKQVFRTDSVKLYIVIGTRNPAITSDFETYFNNKTFTMELSERLSNYILPPSEDNAVYLFTRRHLG